MNIEDWPKPRWGHPLPGWSKYEKPRAVFWFSLLIIIILIGFTLSYLGMDYLLKGITPLYTPKNVQVPLSSEYYFQTVDLAKGYFENTTVSSIILLRDLDTLDKITYIPIIEFCFPDDLERNYQIKVTKVQRIIEENQYIGLYVREENQYSGSYVINEDQDCSDLQMNPPVIPSITAIELAQTYLIDNKEVAYDPWPFLLEAKRGEDRQILWKIEFQQIENHANKLTISLNANNGEILDVLEHADN